MPLYEVAMLQKPTKKEVEEGTASEKLVFGPKAICARDEQGAVVAALLGDDKPTVEISRLEVLVVPFVVPR